jgi:ADP-ribose pyrophosphatase YjhB (NUDIX family)
LTIQPKVRTEDYAAGVCVMVFANEKFWLMRSRRMISSKKVWQAPAGFIETGENALEAAARELHEEMGVEVPTGQIIELGSFWPDAGIIDAKVDLFLAIAHEIDTAYYSGEYGTGMISGLTPEELEKFIFYSSNAGGATLVCATRALRYVRKMIEGKMPAVIIA